MLNFLNAELVPAFAGAHSITTSAIVLATAALVATCCYLSRHRVAVFAAWLGQKRSGKKTCAGSASQGSNRSHMPIRLAISSTSHIGKKRTSQQDRVKHLTNGGIVCDGMGGAGAPGAGEEASLTALETMDNAAAANEPKTRSEARKLLRESMLASHMAVQARAAADPALEGMGSTILAGFFVENYAVVGSMGDSRGYHLGGGVLTQLTKDHTLAQVLVDAGQLTPAQAEAHKYRHVLHRFAGSTDKANQNDGGDLAEHELKPGDRILLSTDGIDKELQPDEIAKILASSDDPVVICQALIDAANANGGSDNIGVIVAVVS